MAHYSERIQRLNIFILPVERHTIQELEDEMYYIHCKVTDIKKNSLLDDSEDLLNDYIEQLDSIEETLNDYVEMLWEKYKKEVEAFNYETVQHNNQ